MDKQIQINRYESVGKNLELSERYKSETENTCKNEIGDNLDVSMRSSVGNLQKEVNF